MHEMIEQFVTYLTDVKKSSANTVVSYRRDLVKFHKFMKFMTFFAAFTV